MGSDGKDDRDDQRTMFAPPNPDALNAPAPGQAPYPHGGFPPPQGGPPPAPPPPQGHTMMSGGNMMGPFPGTMMMPAVGEPGSPFGPPGAGPRPGTPFAAAGAAAQPPQQGGMPMHGGAPMHGGPPMPGGGSPTNPHAGTMIMEVPQPPPGGGVPFSGGPPAQPVNPFATQIGVLQGPQFGTPSPGDPGGPTHRMTGTMYGPAPVPDMPDSEPGGSPRTMIGQPMMFAEPMIISARLSHADGPPSTQSDPRPGMHPGAVHYPAAQPQKRSVLPFVIIGLLVLAGAGVGVAFALGAFKSGEEAGTEPSTIPIPSAKATSTESAAADEPHASSAPTSSASAEESAAPLEDNEAFLTVKSSDKDSDVVLNDSTVGPTNKKLRIKCGAALLRLRGADGTWKSGAKRTTTECKKHNIITLEPSGAAPPPTSSPKKPPPPTTAKPTATPSAAPPPPPRGSSTPKPPPAGPSRGHKKE